MDSIKIPFCNSNGMLIKNDRNKYSILNTINKVLQYDILNVNKNIYSSRKQNDLKHRYTVCTYISSGKECYLYLTKIHNENVSLIVELSTNDKNKFPKITAIPLQFDSKLYQGTLFHGELYRDFKQWYYIAESIKIMNGRKYTNINQYKNISILHKTIDNYYRYIPDLSPLEVIAKKFVSPNKLKKLITDTNIKIKGAVFINNNRPLYYYFNRIFNSSSYLHILPDYTRQETLEDIQNALEDNNQDTSKKDIIICNDIFILKIKKSETYGIYNLYSVYKSEDIYIGIARTDTIEISNMLLDLFKKKEYYNVECVYDNSFKKFKVVRVSNKSVTSHNKLKHALSFET